MTAAQRLRLVLALGVINLILAAVALSIGISGIQSGPVTAGGPTPGTAFVSPAPTTAPTPAAPTGTSPATQPPSPSTPSTPGPTIAPSTGPTGPTGSTQPEPSSSVESVPTIEPQPSVAPTQAPVEPQPSVAPTQAPVEPTVTPPATPPATQAPVEPPATPPATQTPILVVGHPGTQEPTPTPTRTEVPTGSPDITGGSGHPKAAHETKDAKAQAHDQKKIDHQKPKAHRPRSDHQGQPATVDNPRRHHKSGHRLRRGRRTR